MKNNRKLTSLLLIIMMVMLISGCTQTKDEELWKTSLEEYISNIDESAAEGYDLINLDEDQIPELVVYGQSEADGVIIAYFNNEKYDETILARKGFSFIPKEGLLLNSDGNMGHYYDSIYELKDGKMKIIAQGTYEDENSDSSYSWNGEEVSKETYTQNISEIWDDSKAEYPDEDGMLTIDEVIKQMDL